MPSPHHAHAPAPTARAKRGGGPTDPSHDEELRRGILRTDVSRPVAALLVAPFLIAIAALPIAQAILERVRGDQSVLPDLFKQVPTREGLKQFEEDLLKASYPREAVRPQLQLLLTRFGGFGNTKAVLGSKPGWLFYQPGVAAVGGPGLLDGAIMAARRKGALDAGDPPLYPDPRPAILDFHRYLAARGIALVLFPVPDKAGLQPAELHGRLPAGGGAVAPGENPDYQRLVAGLRQAGVRVFDPTPPAIEPGAPPRFLEQDTHWTPAWMEEVAAQLAAFLTTATAGAPSLLPPPAHPRPWRAAPVTVSRVGDIVDMLGLPEGQTLYQPRREVVHPVSDAAGAPFAQAGAELLLLGDSFANVFSLGQMGWGEGAGLAPQLARALGRDVDVIAQNDAGAHATRKLLFNELAAASDTPGGGAAANAGDRLTGKKVVIWELASRELAVGDWSPVAWPRPPAALQPAAPAGAGAHP